MTDPATIEAAARALRDGNEVHAWGDFFESETREISLVVLAAVTPLIRAQVLEEAARVLDDDDGYHPWAASEWDVDLLKRNSRELAAAIRALKEQP